MASTTFIDGQTVIYASWLNDVNSAVYNGTFPNGSISITSLNVTGSVTGAGFTTVVNSNLLTPGPIGSTTPNTGAFTSLSLTSPLSKAYGGTGTTSSTGSGSTVFSTGPTLSNVVLSGTVGDGTHTVPSSNVVDGSAKAWVNFANDGSIRNAMNVSSVTVLGTGWYRVNFTSALSNALYAVSGMCSNNSSHAGVMGIYTNGGGGQTTGYVDVYTVAPSTDSLSSYSTNCVVVFGF